MKKEKVLEKPTDDELRGQIKLACKANDLFWLIAVVIGSMIIISGRYIQGLIMGFVLLLMAGQFLIHQELDKIRLEIREKK